MTEETKEITKWEKLPAELRAQMLSQEQSMFFNVAKFEHAQRIADMFAKSTMVPDQFRGNLGNCMIALNYAARLGADPFMVMQTMYVVKGRPGIEGKLVKGLIDQSGLFSTPLDFEWLDGGDEEIPEQQVVINPDMPDYGCRAYATHAASGKILRGPKITWKIVKAEGWYGKPESKWKTIPEIMFVYRAASWFANRHCPGLKLGMMTTEEIVDAIELKPQANGSFAHQPQPEQKDDKVAALNRKISERQTPPPEPGTPPPPPAPETAPTDPGAGPSPPSVEVEERELVKTFDVRLEETGIPITFINGYLFEVMARSGLKNIAAVKAELTRQGKLEDAVHEIEKYANTKESEEEARKEEVSAPPPTEPKTQPGSYVTESEFSGLKTPGMKSLLSNQQFCKRLLISGDDITTAFALKAKKVLGSFSWDQVRRVAEDATTIAQNQEAPQAEVAGPKTLPSASASEASVWMTDDQRNALHHWIADVTRMGWSRFMPWAVATGSAVEVEHEGQKFHKILAEAAGKILADKAVYLKRIVDWTNANQQ